eukprot:TRINITY_DN8861_c0_g2_i2.p1 TRINITY_DN8861_c0_g2~~TRINITY_DN8861_c0_g2_i2.p1  ORF type:complete len:814 (+),score=248.44 TRINITY_DN8861_c0_g2_i2:99-2540(+)
MAFTTKFDTKYYPLSAYDDASSALKDGLEELPATKVQAAKPTSNAIGDVAELMKLGLTEAKAKDTAKNKDMTTLLLGFLKKSGGSPSKEQGILLFDFGARFAKERHARALQPHVDLIVNYVMEGKYTMKTQLDAACDHLIKKETTEGLEEASGVGVVVTPEQVKEAVARAIEGHKDEIAEKRYRFVPGKLFGALRKTLPWAEGKLVKAEVDAQLAALLGPRTAEDDAPVKKEKKKKAPKSDTDKKEAAATEDNSLTFSGASAVFHEVGQNDKTDGYVVTPHTKRLLAEHVKAVKGKVMTRFPPEPNGILHIGHAKAINFNFAYAKERGGHTYLRYDDTNPEKEEKEFFEGILRDVRWLGHEPYKITHSSDNFQRLYECAVELIKRNLAYVCHQQADEVKGYEDRKFSPWRDRPIEESLKLFEDMKNGLVDEGKATLRMKHTMEDGKLDPIAYRIKFVAHHKSGNEWCIYPTYDFTHCLCDSFENITHSLCTKEFQNRRSSYYWLCNALDQYCPVQWEYGRLNMAYTVVSKRKIGKLITNNIVRGWDDPRLFTLSALRRRGFPPQAINAFVQQVGVTESTVVMQPSMLEYCVRNELNATAPRAMVVLDPIKVVVQDWPAGKVEHVEVPNHPLDESAGVHTVPFCGVVYLDRDDFKENGEKGYRRLTKDQPVALKYVALVLTTKDIIKDNTGKVVEVMVTAEPLTKENKPKAFVHWVSSESSEVEPERAEIRVYSSLFKSANPEESGDFLQDVDRDSLTVYDGFIDAGVSDKKIGATYQFERTGFFVVDPDSDSTRIVFNRTVALKEDSGKKSGK